MANKNETVEEVCELMTGWENHTWMSSTDHKYIGELAKRILTAHKREISAKDAEIDSLKRTLRTAARWIATHDIYGHMGSAILEDAKKLLDDDGRFLG